MCVTFTVGITFSVVITFSGDTWDKAKTKTTNRQKWTKCSQIYFERIFIGLKLNLNQSWH